VAKILRKGGESMKIIKMKAKDIKVGERFRRKLGNIELLAQLIKEEGLLYPILVDKDGNLIDGYRRLVALKQLGIEETEVLIYEAA
jgi:ParB family chromosome partitioning protein